MIRCVNRFSCETERPVPCKNCDYLKQVIPTLVSQMASWSPGSAAKSTGPKGWICLAPHLSTAQVAHCPRAFLQSPCPPGTAGRAMLTPNAQWHWSGFRGSLRRLHLPWSFLKFSCPNPRTWITIKNPTPRPRPSNWAKRLVPFTGATWRCGESRWIPCLAQLMHHINR